MKTLHAIAVVAVLATVAVVGAVGANAPAGRPPGVSADEWAPINDHLGVVLDHSLPGAGDTDAIKSANPEDSSEQSRLGNSRMKAGEVGGAVLIPPVSGYLMMRRGNLWQRVILVEPVKGPGTAG